MREANWSKLERVGGEIMENVLLLSAPARVVKIDEIPLKKGHRDFAGVLSDLKRHNELDHRSHQISGEDHRFCRSYGW
jgi:hypothetical protein